MLPPTSMLALRLSKEPYAAPAFTKKCLSNPDFVVIAITADVATPYSAGRLPVSTFTAFIKLALNKLE